MKFLFHVGMGKTGSTAIQHSLAQSEAELATAGLRYIGMWAPWIGSEHDGSVAFHRFLALPPEKLREEADRFLDWAAALGRSTGASGLVHSNESFHSVPFFQRLAEKADIRLVAYVRAPARWLPSAYMQWGIAHKTNAGPVAPFGATGRRMMAQYRAIRTLSEALGPLLDVRAYPEGGDVLEDLGSVIGVTLKRPAGRLQSRPSPVEAMFRAAFNSGVRESILPRAFNEAVPALRGSATPVPAIERARALFDLSELPQIVAENAELLRWFDDRFGFDLASATPDPRDALGAEIAAAPEGPGSLSDRLLGALIDVTVSQAREIARLKAQVAAIEARLGGQ